MEKNLRALASKEVWCLADSVSGVAHAARLSEMSNSWDHVVIGYRIPERISRPLNSGGRLEPAGLIVTSEFSKGTSDKAYRFDKDYCRLSDDEGSVYIHLILKRLDCEENNMFLSKSICDKIVEVCFRYGVFIQGTCTINGRKQDALVRTKNELENVVRSVLTIPMDDTGIRAD